MIHQASKLESWYEEKAAGGRGGTHSSSTAAVRVQAVVTGFLLGVFFFDSFSFQDLVFFPVGSGGATAVASTSGFSARMGGVSLDGSLVSGAGGRKDLKKRMCTDYRYLNEWMVKNAYLLLLISEIINSLCQIFANFFSEYKQQCLQTLLS